MSKLHIQPQTLCQIIGKVREFQAKEEVVLPDVPSSPTEDWGLQMLADHSDDMALVAMTEAIAEMSQRQRAELVALMWLGRGDYELEDWETAVDDAVGEYSLRAAAYLLVHPMVADDLEEGLIAFGYSCQE
ncbi:DUF3775 domain-containing protein [Marichromatium gracile]|uniref:DUF3775 domain-containing protein n=1 Tax=Marichromatium purpuratum 984 TaxID=765910 RepID=W0E4W9_MARPU|nr:MULTISPECIES: DUF3775 domain-containing protein [Marichromatium]AHF04116.1 hypothetical protein MARPU_09840 [Marichromatium purpuratum 984]MCF1184438.1 DUF3775 domain-containing protein [Marichromatium gracile]